MLAVLNTPLNRQRFNFVLGKKFLTLTVRVCHGSTIENMAISMNRFVLISITLIFFHEKYLIMLKADILQFYLTIQMMIISC